MKKALIILCGTLICVISLHAQPRVSVGMRGGANSSWLTHNNHDVGSFFPHDGSPRIAFRGGIFAEMAFSERFALRAGVEYSQQGAASVAAGQLFYTESHLVERFLGVTGKGKLDYLTLPVMALVGWNFGQHYRFYTGAGIQPAYLLKSEIAPVDYYVYVEGYASDDINRPPVVIPDELLDLTKAMPLTDAMRRFDLDVLLLAGFSRSFGANTIHLEAGFNLGLLDVWNDSQTPSRNLGANLMFGYSRRLGK